jgi:hypothetical protein
MKEEKRHNMIYPLAVIFLLFAAWILVMGIRAMRSSELGGTASSSRGITLDDEDAFRRRRLRSSHQVTAASLPISPGSAKSVRRAS